MDALTDLLMTLLGAGLAAWFALRIYHQQREYELVLSRYLEGGVDCLAGDLERIAAVFAHNWARALAILKNYRDLEGSFDTAELSKGFLELQASSLQVAAHHRLHTLTGSSALWQAYQHATAFYTNANSILTSEIMETIRVAVTTDRVDATPKQVAEQAFNIAEELNNKHIEYVKLIEVMQRLSMLLETEKFTFQSIREFHKKQEVVSLVGRVQQLLPVDERGEQAKEAGS